MLPVAPGIPQRAARSTPRVTTGEPRQTYTEACRIHDFLAFERWPDPCTRCEGMSLIGFDGGQRMTPTREHDVGGEPAVSRREACLRGTTLQNGFFVTLLALVTIAFVAVLFRFLMPLFWAAVLGVLFQPLHDRLTGPMRGHTSLAALATVAIAMVLVVLPLALVGLLVSREVTGLYERLEANGSSIEKPLDQATTALPVLNGHLERLGMDAAQVRQRLTEAVTATSGFLASHALQAGQGAVRFLVLLALMLYLLFFFLRDGRGLVARAVRTLPLRPGRGEALLSRFAEVSRATIKGTFVVGAAQGTLGGLAFWVLGLPTPALFGTLMALLSLVPAVGPPVVWGPAAVYLLLTGSIAKALVLIAVGVLAIGLVDNILRPLLVGRETRMPDFLVLLATVGGLSAFGASGFVIGPILASFFVTFWGMFEEEFSHETTVATPVPTEMT
jgi:predicted PurR-regulated permease PerM